MQTYIYAFQWKKKIHGACHTLGHMPDIQFKALADLQLLAEQSRHPWGTPVHGGAGLLISRSPPLLRGPGHHVAGWPPPLLRAPAQWLCDVGGPGLHWCILRKEKTAH